VFLKDVGSVKYPSSKEYKTYQELFCIQYNLLNAPKQL